MATCSRWRSVAAATAVLLATLLPVAAAGGTADPLLPGVSGDDGRVPVDITAAPWSAVVRVQTNLGGRCTGALVAADRVVTAAHCLHNPRTRRLFEAGSLHVLFGYDGGTYSSHRTVRRFVVGPGFDGRRPGASRAADWAVLHLDAGPPPPAAPLAVADRPPPPGTPVALAGFSQDRAHRLMAHRTCQVTGSAGALLRHDCSASRGASGGPLLIRDAGEWRVVGVAVAVSKHPRGVNLAVPAAAWRAALDG